MLARPRFCFDGQPIEVHRTPVPHVVIDGVFGEAVCDQLLAELVSLQAHFVPAGIGAKGEAASFRQHLVFGADAYAHDDEAPQDFPAVLQHRAKRSALLAAIDSLLVDGVLREVMDGAPFPLCKLREINRWETQVSRYGDGDRYGWHLDRIGSDDRVLSLVYYLCQSPAPFHGGELELSAGLARDGKLIASGPSRCIEAKRDRLVIFSARTVHRVQATKAPSAFGEGRFSVNVFCGIDGSPIDAQVY